MVARFRNPDLRYPGRKVREAFRITKYDHSAMNYFDFNAANTL
jgi:hypothetical protein